MATLNMLCDWLSIMIISLGASTPYQYSQYLPTVRLPTEALHCQGHCSLNHRGVEILLPRFNSLHE